MGSENMSNIGPTKHVVGIEDNLESFYSGTDEKKYSRNLSQAGILDYLPR